MPLKIVYDTVECFIALDNAGIFNGENDGFGWSTHFKQNATANLSGAPGQFANNNANYSLNIIKDNDFIDCVINDQDTSWGELTSL